MKTRLYSCAKDHLVEISSDIDQKGQPIRIAYENIRLTPLLDSFNNLGFFYSRDHNQSYLQTWKILTLKPNSAPNSLPPIASNYSPPVYIYQSKIYPENTYPSLPPSAPSSTMWVTRDIADLSIVLRRSCRLLYHHQPWHDCAFGTRLGTYSSPVPS